MLHTEIIATQPAAAAPAPEIGVVEQFGLMGVIGFLVVREALAWFRSKEAKEDDLIASLVEDLRATQRELLDKLFDLHTRQHEDLSAVRDELEAIREHLDRLEKQAPQLRRGTAGLM
jgi:Tfp pilus assembly protein PilO